MTRRKDTGKQPEKAVIDGMDDETEVDETEEDEDEEEEEEEEEEHEQPPQQHQRITDYEKQREQRIRENAAKLAALKLPSIALSFQNSGDQSKQKSPAARSKRSGRRKKLDDDEVEDDDDYQPSDHGSDSETEDSENEQSRPLVKVANQAAAELLDKEENGNDDEDWALQQALALSLGTSLGELAGKSGFISSPKIELLDGIDVTNGYNMKGEKDERMARYKRQIPASHTPRKRQRKGMKKQLQFAEHEVAAFFSLIDEQGNGKFSATELERVASSHDFTWGKQELIDMIDLFDRNKDGQLDFTEFRDMLVLGNMLKMPSDE